MTPTPKTPAAPTTAEIRHAISVIYLAARDPYTEPTAIADSHRLLVTVQAVVERRRGAWLRRTVTFPPSIVRRRW